MEKIEKILLKYISYSKNYGKGGWHKYDVFEHTLKVVKQIKLFFKQNILNLKNYNNILNYFNDTIDNIKKQNLLIYAAYLHDIGKKDSLEKNGNMKDHVNFSVIKINSNEIKNLFSKNQFNYIENIIKNHHSNSEKNKLDIAILSYFDSDSTRGKKYYQINQITKKFIGDEQQEEKIKKIQQFFSIIEKMKKELDYNPDDYIEDLESID